MKFIFEIPFNFILTLMILITSSTGRAQKQICKDIVVNGAQIELNGNEKILICGSLDGPEAWNKVPLNQAEFHVRRILNSLGYFRVKTEINGNKLFIETGPRQTINKISVQGLTNFSNIAKLRNVFGHPLTAPKLDEIESWANLKLQSHGYGCPAVSLKADSKNGNVSLFIEPALPTYFSRVFLDNSSHLNADILSRYQPFAVGDKYDVRKTQIMTDRLISDGLFQSAYFETKCDGDSALLYLHSSIGRPKILRFGIGASTEEFPFADLTFRNAQLDNIGSSLTTNLHASPRLYSIDFTSELYWFRGWHKTYFSPRGHLSRQLENIYRLDSARFGADIGRKWDQWDTRFQVRLGPSLNIVKAEQGLTPENARFPSFDANLLLMSADYEYSRWQQYQGWMASIETRSQSKDLGSDYNVNRYELNYKHLWNIGGYTPPLFVLGSRIQLDFVDAGEINQADPTTLIPLADRTFVGGDQNLRGFARKSINNLGNGYLNFLYLGWELRLTNLLPRNFQPLILLDFGQTGTRRYTLDPAQYWSYGIGFRWPTPIGTFRGTLAKGEVQKASGTSNYPEEWVGFFSFGQEF